MHTLRARFGKDKAIVVEFLPPKKDLGKVIIICSGMPAMPNPQGILARFAKKNYWAMHIRYRGTWESAGEFLAKSPHIDVLDVIAELDKPIISLWDNVEYNINAKEIVIAGSSFGGPAALLVSGDERVKKVIGFSPVVDWREETPEEPMDFFKRFTQEAFGQAYRFSSENWDKLARGEFYNPVTELDKINGSKVLLFHALDDTAVPYEPTLKFANTIGAELVTMKSGDHICSGVLKKYRYRRKIWKFLDK